MSDLIDRQALLKQIEIDSEGIEGSYGDTWKFIDTIKNMPSAQPNLQPTCNQLATDTISRQAAIDFLEGLIKTAKTDDAEMIAKELIAHINNLPSAEPQERKTGRWILDRSGAYCCSKCMEPCATYVMMRPRDKFCKMCGSRNEVDNG